MQSKAPHKEILLVEDNEVNREVAIDMLEGIGFDADVASDGRQAIESYRNNQYSVILMDCEMPVLDGFLATKKIRKIESKLMKVPVSIIALTAHETKETMEKCLACGMDDFLSKPFNISTLNAVLNKWLINGVNLANDTDSDEDLQHSDSYDFNCDTNILDCNILSSLYIKQIRDDSNIMVKVIEAYITQSGNLISDLAMSSQKSDAQTVRKISHTLKSSSLHVGASMMSELCNKLENSSNQGLIEDVLVQRVLQHYSEVERALNNILLELN